MGTLQGLDKLRTDAPTIEDVGRQRNAVPGRVDRGEHGRVGLRTIELWLDAIAIGQRLAGGACHQTDQTGERRRQRVRNLLEVADRGSRL
jgi:hypothetical protein